MRVPPLRRQLSVVVLQLNIYVFCKRRIIGVCRHFFAQLYGALAHLYGGFAHLYGAITNTAQLYGAFKGVNNRLDSLKKLV